MSGDIPNLRRRLQELHELHATGFVDDAQYAESQTLLERWIVDAVMKESAADLMQDQRSLPGPGPGGSKSPRRVVQLQHVRRHPQPAHAAAGTP